MDFLEIFTSGMNHRDMKILKILVSNSKQTDDDMGEGGVQPNTIQQYNNFLDNFRLKQPLVLKILLSMFFDSRNSKMTSKVS